MPPASSWMPNISDMLAAVVTAVTTASSSARHLGERGGPVTISGRHVHFSKFDGKLNEWDDRSYAKKIIISQNSTVSVCVTDAENAREDVDEDVLPVTWAAFGRALQLVVPIVGRRTTCHPPIRRCSKRPPCVAGVVSKIQPTHNGEKRQDVLRSHFASEGQ